MMNLERQRILDGIEALYPADSPNSKLSFIGQVLMNHALENSLYNWRELPLPVLARYLAVCEDFERQSEQSADLKVESPLPGYLKR